MTPPKDEIGAAKSAEKSPNLEFHNSIDDGCPTPATNDIKLSAGGASSLRLQGMVIDKSAEEFARVEEMYYDGVHYAVMVGEKIITGDEDKSEAQEFADALNAHHRARVEKKLEREHENFLSVHRDNMALATRNMEMKKALQSAESRAKGLVEYCEHKSDCIRSFQSQGRPTADGGYEVMIKGEWFQVKPENKTPKCDCGLDEALGDFNAK